MKIELVRVRVPVSDLDSADKILGCAAVKLQEDRKGSTLPTIRIISHNVSKYSQVDAHNTLLVEVRYQELPPGATEWPPMPDLQAEQVVKTVRGSAPDGRQDPAGRFRRNRNSSMAWRQDTNNPDRD